jgi:hypothetical protein
MYTVTRYMNMPNLHFCLYCNSFVYLTAITIVLRTINIGTKFGYHLKFWLAVEIMELSGAT